MAQFPVSSGKQHQMVENVWVPVTKSNTSATTSSTDTTTTTAASTSSSSKKVVTLQKQIQEQLPELAKPKPLPPPPPLPQEPINPALLRPYDWKSDDHYCKTIVPTLAPPSEVSETFNTNL